MQGHVTSLPLVAPKLGVRDPLVGQRSGLSALDVLRLREPLLGGKRQT